MSTGADIETRVRALLADTATGANRWSQASIVAFLKNDALPWLLSARPSSRYNTLGVALTTTTIATVASTIPTDSRWDAALAHKVTQLCLENDPTTPDAKKLAQYHADRAQEIALQ